MSDVLRGFASAAYVNVRLNKSPCAALLIKKILIFELETYFTCFLSGHYLNLFERDVK